MKPYFHFGIRTAYPFRNAIGILKNYTKYLTFKCNSDGLKIEECAQDGKLFFSVSWDKNWVSSYSLLPLKDPYTENDFVLEFGVKSEDFEKETSLISKKGGFDMKMIEEDSQKIELCLDKPGTSYVTVSNNSHINVTAPDLSGQEPFIKICVDQFSGICKQFKKLNCSEVMIECFEEGVAFIGMTAEQKIKKCVDFGVCESKETKNLNSILEGLSGNSLIKPNDNNSEIDSYPVVIKRKKNIFQLDIASFYGLAKINNLAPGADIGMYYNTGSCLNKEGIHEDFSLLWIHCPIAYGSNFFSIFVREIFPQDKE